MANYFSLGGQQSIIAHRQLSADDRWLPDSSVTLKDFVGAAVPSPVTTEWSGVDVSTGYGFFQKNRVSVGVVFHGLVNAVVALQVYIPNFTGGAAWKNIIPTSKWEDGVLKVFDAPSLPWRVGCVTLNTDTLYCTVMYGE